MFDKNYLYHLQKYTGPASRHECPQCGDPHSFVYYVDRNGVPVDKTCGRCNHESGCGYHYTPGQYFRDNPSAREQRARVERYTVPVRRVYVQPSPAPDYVPNNVVTATYDGECSSALGAFLCGVLDPENVRKVWRSYLMGTTQDGASIFWEVDGEGHTRTGKIIQYDKETGHRTDHVNWVHAVLKRRGELPATFHLEQCLFGEHLLRQRPEAPVALVEAEKTAVVGAACFPGFVWVATGGKSQWGDKMRPLFGRRVIAFPDVDATTEWERRALTLNVMEGYDIKVSTALYRLCDDEEYLKKIDVADWLLTQRPRPTETAVKAPSRPSTAPTEQPQGDGEIVVLVPIVDALLTPTGNVVEVKETEIRGYDLRRLCAELDTDNGSYRIHVLPAPLMPVPAVERGVPEAPATIIEDGDNTEDLPF